MKVGVSLGVTLCTNPEVRNYARLGFDIEDIDTEGDIEAQAQESVNAILKTFTVANDGLETAVIEALGAAPTDGSTSIKEDVIALKTGLNHLSTALIPNIVGKVKQLEAKINTDKRGDIDDGN